MLTFSGGNGKDLPNRFTEVIDMNKKVSVLRSEVLNSRKRKMCWFSFMLFPLVSAGVGFGLGLLIGPSRPKLIYPVGIGLVALIAFVWGAYEYAQRVAYRTIEAYRYTVEMNSPKYIDKFDFMVIGIAKVMSIRANDESGKMIPVRLAGPPEPVRRERSDDGR